jgi:regulator of protease activity HflC (stomatin/prohibitin superfamily)
MFDKLIDLIIQFIELFRFWCVILQYEGGIILRLGKFHRMLTPGFHWMWPFNIEMMHYTDVNMYTRIVGPQSLTTQDDKSLIVSVVITMQVEDVKKFILDCVHGHSVVEDATYGAVATLIHSLTWDQIMQADVARQLEIIVRRQAKKYGVNILQLQLVDLSRSKSLRLMQPYVEATT